ncbi:MAG: TrkH family potassium uptake protein [Candidatus Heteroscillospira sp.]
MNYRLIFNIIGRILCVEAIFMLPALLISLFYGESASALAFAQSAAITFGAGLAMCLLLKPRRRGYFARDGFVTVGFAWILVSAFGALPMCISGAIPNYVDALFETISGFTTTGSTILTDIEILPRGVLYWRSFTHWLGGMGVLVFILAIGPRNGDGESVHVLRAESPGPSVGKLVPRIQQSASILYKIYIGMTILQAVLLLLCGMPLFDAVTITFGTAGTGGFAITNNSLAAYNTAAQAVTTFFMIAFGVNFSLFYLLLIRDFKTVYKNEELRAYLGIIALSVAAIAINILPMYGSVFEAVHHSAFQVASIISTTGYATVNFDTWPQFSRTLLFLLMFVGAMAGSTGGGLKVVRVSLIMKSVRRAIATILHPNSVKLVHMDGERVDEEVVDGVKEYILIYLLILAGSVLLISLDPFVNFEATVTGVVTCLNNVGPGLGLIGPVCNFSEFTAFSKIILAIDMLLGRLELFPILILAVPSAWKK